MSPAGAVSRCVIARPAEEGGFVVELRPPLAAYERLSADLATRAGAGRVFPYASPARLAGNALALLLKRDFVDWTQTGEGPAAQAEATRRRDVLSAVLSDFGHLVPPGSGPDIAA